MLSSQCNFCALVWDTKDSTYLHIALVLLTEFYMYIISPLVESHAIAGLIYNFRHTVTPRIICVIPENYRLLLIILAGYAYL